MYHISALVICKPWNKAGSFSAHRKSSELVVVMNLHYLHHPLLLLLQTDLHICIMRSTPASGWLTYRLVTYVIGYKNLSAERCSGHEDQLD